MAQITSGLRRILNHPSVYNALQASLGVRGLRAWLVKDFIRPRAGDTLLDIGCGTGELVDYLPTNVTYFGFDLSPSYIASARDKYGDRGTFECGDVNDFDTDGEIIADLVMSLGVLHHLDDKEVLTLLDAAWSRLRPGGRLITMDCAIVDGQSRIARALISRDRGQNVRTLEAYEGLIASRFEKVRYVVRHDLLNVPYTHVVSEATRL